MLLVEEQLAGMAKWVHSLLRLEFAACSVMLNIATSGFCKPPDASEQGEAGTEDDTSAGGVGIGEGTGNQNVNKEIEDESQVEGLKDESGGDGERDEGGENGDDAIEVSDDFQGGLENIPDGGSEGEETPTDDGPEETLGDLDVGDPDTIDEKLWGDETGPRDEGQLGRANEDHSTKPSSHSEVVAKENEPPENDQVSQETKDEGAGDKGNDAESNEAMPEDQVDEDNGDATHGEDGAALDDFVQDADILDLPDDLEMDEGTKQQDLGEEMDDDVLDDDWRQPEISPEPSPHPIDEIADGESLDDQRQEGGDAEPGLEDPCEDQDVSMRPDVQTGDGPSTEVVPDGTSNSNVHEDTSESQSGGARGARVTSESEARRDDASVHLSGLLIYGLTFVSAMPMTSSLKVQPQKTGVVVVPMPVPRQARYPLAKPSPTRHPSITRAVWEMHSRIPLRTLTISLKATILQQSRQRQIPRHLSCSTSTMMMLITICKLSALRELKKLPSLATSTLRMSRKAPTIRIR